VGVTAGASAPEVLVQQVVARLREWGGEPPAERSGREEHVVFALPRALRAPRKEDICYATQNRQDAVKDLLRECDVLVVVGSKSSSNSNRLRELADRAGVPGYLVDGADDLRQEWFTGRRAVGVTAGASAPEVLVQQVVARLREWGGEPPAERSGREEHVVFGLPRALRAPDGAL
jgi:4-hydroxy-3-methylbut-2-enyl diphosphate reductase